jgi:hypothetical protein
MRLFQPLHRLRDQRGQMFGGYIVAIIVVMLLAISVIQKITAQRKSSTDEYFREQAINVAKAGFEEGTSFFRRQPGGVDLASSPYCPSNNLPITTTAWPLWPDAAFAPGVTNGIYDTDYYAQTLTSTSYAGLTVPAMVCAAGIIRTFPLIYSNASATAQVAVGSQLWGRFVLKRQNARNWSPGSNTYAAFTDPEAVHDISAIKTSSALGAGTNWSILSHGYVYAYPTDLTIPAAFTGNSILNPPLMMYNGKRLLLAQASVYGEISRMNFNLPFAAVYLYRADKLLINGMGYVDGTGGFDAAAPASTGTFNPLNGGASVPSVPTETNSAAPSLGTVFPGMTGGALQQKANKAGTMTSIFPCPADTNFNAEVDTATFLYCTDTGGTVFQPAGASTVNQLTGIGLAYFAGNLTVSAGSLSSWAGVVYVNGNVYLQGPADISGILIATGTVTIGNAATPNKATVEYNKDAIATAEQLLQNFTVTENSVVVTSQ